MNRMFWITYCFQMPFQIFYVTRNVIALIMQNHRNIVKWITRIAFSKIARLIDKDA